MLGLLLWEMGGKGEEGYTGKSETPRLGMTFVGDSILAVKSLNHVLQVAVGDGTCLGRILFLETFQERVNLDELAVSVLAELADEFAKEVVLSKIVAG